MYYVTFRHSRELGEFERQDLYASLMKPQGRKWDVFALSVRESVTELLISMETDGDGRPHELSDVVEKAKQRAGKKIIKATGERYPPFYFESYDRIVRDEAELIDFLRAMVAEDDGLASWLPEVPGDPEGVEP